MADDTSITRRDSGIRLRSDIDRARALSSAQAVIARLEAEIARLGDALETQRACYERALADERDERRQVITTRGDRVRRLLDENAQLREDAVRLAGERDSARWAQRRIASSLRTLRADHERTGHAYRASLAALRTAYESQLDVA